MTLSEFYDQLEQHDWYYNFSDDHGVWRRGTSDADRLKRISEESPEHKKLHDAFEEYHFSGESFGKPNAPKPTRPTK